MKLDEDDAPYDEINITPLLDVMLVLLVIFILMTTASLQGIKVQLPTASATQTLVETRTRVIAVANDGQVSIDAIPVSIGELEGELRNALANDPTLPIILRGDRTVQYEKIMEVLDLCSRVGVSAIGLQTQRPRSAALPFNELPVDGPYPVRGA